MTFTRMLDWIGGPPSEAAAKFDAVLDAELVEPVGPPAAMSKEQKRAVLEAGIRARGETPVVAV